MTKKIESLFNFCIALYKITNSFFLKVNPRLTLEFFEMGASDFWRDEEVITNVTFHVMTSPKSRIWLAPIFRTRLAAKQQEEKEYRQLHSVMRFTQTQLVLFTNIFVQLVSSLLGSSFLIFPSRLLSVTLFILIWKWNILETTSEGYSEPCQTSKMKFFA